MPPLEAGEIKIRDTIRDALAARIREQPHYTVTSLARRVGMSRGRVYEYLQGRDIGVSRALAMLAAVGLELLIVDSGEVPTAVLGAKRAKRPVKATRKRLVGPLPGGGGYRS